MNGVSNTNCKVLIINSLQGAGGHRLGRIFSCYESVYWYSHSDNGICPWEFRSTSNLNLKEFSKYHYDRTLTNGDQIPLIGSRIEKYWDNTDWIKNWNKLMNNLFLPTKLLTFVVHDSPKYLREIFPKSIIVNHVCDPEYATKRHLETSANYKIKYTLKNQTPSYKSRWVNDRDKLLLVNLLSTEKDLWMFRHNCSYSDYCKAMFEFNDISNKKNILENDYADITVKWEELNLFDHEVKLGKINKNFEKLLVTQ